MTTDERQQRMAERILEDEHLRGDLEDDSATALINWASKRAAAAAADPDRSDAAVEDQVQAIRQAARAAAVSGETAPKRLVALATAKLASSAATAPAASPSAPTPSVAAVAAQAPVVAETPAPMADATASAAAMPDAPPESKPGGTVRKRARRTRNRLARFLKHLQAGR